MINNILSCEEAAAVISVTDGRIRQLLRSKELAGIKLNKRAWGISVSELRRFAKKCGHPFDLEKLSSKSA